MKLKTWLAGTALAAMVAVNAANAGEIYIANLRGSAETPPSTAAYTGMGYFAMDAGEGTGTYWFTHNIPNSVLTSARIERPNGTVKYNFPGNSLFSPGGPFPTIFLNPTADNPIVRAGNLFMNFYTTDFPTGAIGGFFTRYTFAAPTGGSRALTPIVGLLNYNTPASTEFNEVLIDLAQVPVANLTEAYNQMSGRTLYSQSVQMLDSMSGFESTILSHANEAAPPLGNFTLFAKAGYAVGKRADTVDQAGAKIARPYIVAGIDYGLGTSAVAGLAVAYADGRDKFDGGLGQTNVSTIGGLGYVTASVARIVIQATAGYGQSEIATTRNMTLIGRTATGRHHGNVWTIAGRVSMPYAIDARTTLSPYLLIDTQYASLDSYSEKATTTRAGECNLAIQNYLSYCGGGFTPNAYNDKDFGFEIGGMLKAGLGPDFGARFEAGYRQSLDKGGNAIQTLYAGAPLKFNSVILGRSPAAGHVALAVSTASSDTISGEIGYEGYFSGRMTSHVLQARLTFHLFEEARAGRRR